MASEAQRRANAKYDERHDKIYCRFEKGTLDRIAKLGSSANAYIKLAVAEKLAHDEALLNLNHKETPTT